MGNVTKSKSKFTAIESKVFDFKIDDLPQPNHSAGMSQSLLGEDRPTIAFNARVVSIIGRREYAKADGSQGASDQALIKYIDVFGNMIETTAFIAEKVRPDIEAGGYVFVVSTRDELYTSFSITKASGPGFGQVVSSSDFDKAYEALLAKQTDTTRETL